MNTGDTGDTVRVRFAPSPTGSLHVGGARTALFNWAYARHHGGTFILRVEDTDVERSTPEFEAAILDGMRWLGIDWDEGPEAGGDHGPYRQSERIERHREYVQRVLDAGFAYPCFCESERLTALREEQMAKKETPAYDRRCRSIAPDEASRRVAAGEPHVVRFNVPEGETRFLDHIRGEVTFQNVEVDDWIMVRMNGSPTYNFVVVCDDADMQITHVLRGVEHLVNTPKQVLLYAALGLDVPEFGHLPLMLGADKKKLSKRTGDTALEDYRARGFSCAAVVNFLCLQGWALDGETEVFSTDELVAKFEIKDVSKGGAVFDMDKFLWLSGEYVRKEPLKELVTNCAPFVVAAGLMSAAELEERSDWFARVTAGEQERIRLYSELPERIGHYFAADDQVAFDPKAEKNARKHAGGVEVLGSYLEWLRSETAGGIDADALRDATKAWLAERELKFPQLFQPLRCALTGQPGGRDLFEIMDLLGTEKVLRRIECGMKRLA